MHTHSLTHNTEDLRSGSFYSSPLTDLSPSPSLSLSGCFCVSYECM